MFSLATWVTLFQRAVMQGVPILFGATGEILTEKSGNLNLGIPGIMYVGGISGVIGSFLYEQHVTELNPFLAVLIPLICTLFGSLLMGSLYCFLTVTLRANQNVTGLAITTFGVGFGNFFGASMVQLTGSDIPSVALTRTSTYFRAHLPIAEKMGAFGEMFLSYGFLAYVSIVIAIVCAVFLKRTRGGLHLRAVGENPATADAAGINVERSKYMATCIGSMIAGLGGLYYVMDYACGVWSNDGFGDRGWLAIALVIFAIWRPNLAIFGSILFGFLYIVYLFIPGLDLSKQELFKIVALCGDDPGIDRYLYAQEERKSGTGRPRSVLFPGGTLMHENIERVLVSEEELHQINARLGAQITTDYAGKNLLVVGILKGSVLFMADLIREIQPPCKLDFLAVSSYGGDTRSSGVVKIVKDIDIELEDYDVLLVEDILDSGRTLSYVCDIFAYPPPGQHSRGYFAG